MGTGAAGDDDRDVFGTVGDGDAGVRILGDAPAGTPLGKHLGDVLAGELGEGRAGVLVEVLADVLLGEAVAGEDLGVLGRDGEEGPAAEEDVLDAGGASVAAEHLEQAAGAPAGPV